MKKKITIVWCCNKIQHNQAYELQGKLGWYWAQNLIEWKIGPRFIKAQL